MKVGTILSIRFRNISRKIGYREIRFVNSRISVFRDGKLLLDGKPTPISISDQKGSRTEKGAGCDSSGKQMEAGYYILQFVVSDDLTNGKSRIATQFVEFEVE